VVVAYYGAEELRTCLATVSVRYAVTVVDNSQSREVAEVVEGAGARYIDAGGNVGFAAGVNLALSAIRADPPADVLLLNPDAHIAADDVAELHRFLHAAGNDRIAAVSPDLVDRQGRRQRVVWPFPTPRRAILEAIGLGRIRGRDCFVIGAVMMLRWEAIREVGPFDERFFLYGEETDWQRRALALEWRSTAYPRPTAVHTGAGTSGDPARRHALFHAAHETYIRKWFGRSGWLVYRTATVAGALARSAVFRGDRSRLATDRAALYIRGPRRMAGFD